MKLSVYNLEGVKKSDIEANDAVFGVAVKPGVVHEVFVALMNNQRESWADTKGRGDVRGGGKKPWPQKGTGRARHGSSRSPIWKGGGVTFGPKTERNYKTKLNKTKRRLAIRMCLSDKAKIGAMYVLESFDFKDVKTKAFAALLKNLPAKQHSFLVLTPGKQEAVLKMTNNIPKVETVRAEDVNVMELMNKQAVITSIEGVKALEKVFAAK